MSLIDNKRPRLSLDRGENSDRVRFVFIECAKLLKTHTRPVWEMLHNEVPLQVAKRFFVVDPISRCPGSVTIALKILPGPPGPRRTQGEPDQCAGLPNASPETSARLLSRWPGI